MPQRCRCDHGPVFERFEESTRRVLVVAQQEARGARSGHIGTEHLLLALVTEGVAAEALAAADLTLEKLRAQYATSGTVAASAGAGSGAPPFTPRAKKVLELAFREALARGSPTVGPGDLLVGLLAEGEGIGVRLVVATGVDPGALRVDVLSRLASRPVEPPRDAVRIGPTLGARPMRGRPGPGRSFESCVLCGRDAWEVPHLVSDGTVMICQICVEDAAAALRGAPDDERRVALPPRVFGTEPTPGDAVAIARAVAAAVGPEPEGGWDDVVEDGAELRPYVLEARSKGAVEGAQGVVRRLRFDSSGSAWVYLTVSLGETATGISFEGPVRLIDGRWRVTRQLMTGLLSMAGVVVPPKD